MTFLPGSINAADRFARVSFLINAIPTKLDPHTITAVPAGTYENQAVAGVLSVMRSIGVPLGITHPTKPNISSTLWRTVVLQEQGPVLRLCHESQRVLGSTVRSGLLGGRLSEETHNGRRQGLRCE